MTDVLQASAQALWESARSHKLSAESHRRSARAAMKAFSGIVEEAEKQGLQIEIQHPNQPKGGRLVMGRKQHHGHETENALTRQSR